MFAGIALAHMFLPRAPTIAATASKGLATRVCGQGCSRRVNYSVAAVDPLIVAQEQLAARGFDPESFWEQRIVWGDHDSFQHVNNVRYARFFESARIKWMISLGNELGGESKARDMMNGKGVSLILKSLEIQYRRPVTYPDTLLIGYRPEQPELPETDPATLRVSASAYSLGQRAFVAHAHETIVWYDYERLRKHTPDDATRRIVYGRCDINK